jgi:two-component system invasion response regulator UvrY
MVEPRTIRVFLIDDHAVVRAGFRQLLVTAPDIEVVGEAESAEAAARQLRVVNPQVLLLDISLPGGISGIEAIARFRRLVPDMRIVMLSMHESAPFPEMALAQGASGYLSKRCAAEELLTAVREVTAGRKYLSSVIAQRIALGQMGGGRSGLRSLTQREFEVFEHLAAGLSVKEIAEMLHLSPKTVHVHRSNLMRKLEARNSMELVSIAIREGVLDLGRNPPECA